MVDKNEVYLEIKFTFEGQEKTIKLNEILSNKKLLNRALKEYNLPEVQKQNFILKYYDEEGYLCTLEDNVNIFDLSKEKSDNLYYLGLNLEQKDLAVSEVNEDVHNNIENENNELKKELEKTKKDYEDLKKILKNNKKEYEKLEKIMENKERENEESKQKLIEKNNEYEKLKKEFEKLERIIAELKNKINLSKNMENEKLKNNKENEELKRKIEQMDKKIKV